MPLLESSPSTSALVSAMRCGAFSGVRSSSCSVAKGTSSEVRERRTNFPVATVLVKPPLGGPFHQKVTNQLTPMFKRSAFRTGSLLRPSGPRSSSGGHHTAWCHQRDPAVWEAYHALVLWARYAGAHRVSSAREFV